MRSLPTGLLHQDILAVVAVPQASTPALYGRHAWQQAARRYCPARHSEVSNSAQVKGDGRPQNASAVGRLAALGSHLVERADERLEPSADRIAQFAESRPLLARHQSASGHVNRRLRPASYSPQRSLCIAGERLSCISCIWPAPNKTACLSRVCSSEADAGSA